MIRVFCDRCNLEITDEIQKQIQYFLPVSEEEGRDGVQLCPACKKGLVRWWRGEANGKEEASV